MYSKLEDLGNPMNLHCADNSSLQTLPIKKTLPVSTKHYLHLALYAQCPSLLPSNHFETTFNHWTWEFTSSMIAGKSYVGGSNHSLF
jgi:hypothetical protein